MEKDNNNNYYWNMISDACNNIASSASFYTWSAAERLSDVVVIAADYTYHGAAYTGSALGHASYNAYYYTNQALTGFFASYILEPIDMTLKHVWNEMPSMTEIFSFAPIKFVVKGFLEFIGLNLGYDVSQLSGDSTYFGSFIGDFVKFAQTTVGYGFGWNYGTSKYEWYRPAADVYKGACKIALLKTPLAFSSAARNAICDISGQTFLDTMAWAHPMINAEMEESQNSSYLVAAYHLFERSFEDSWSQYDDQADGILSQYIPKIAAQTYYTFADITYKWADGVNWIADFRKILIGRVISAKLAVSIADYLSTPLHHAFDGLTHMMSYGDMLYNFVFSRFLGQDYLPYKAEFLKEWFVSSMMMSISRASIYTPKQRVETVNVERDGADGCDMTYVKKRLREVYAEASEKGVGVEYIDNPEESIDQLCRKLDDSDNLPLIIKDSGFDINEAISSACRNAKEYWYDLGSKHSEVLIGVLAMDLGYYAHALQNNLVDGVVN